MKYELKQHFQIESARFLPKLSKTHPCSKMHGHSFKIILTLVGDLDPEIGWVMDYHQISLVMKPILAELDHRVLNEIAGLENPTSELLAKWLYERVSKQISMLKHISILETPSTECRYPA